MWHKSKSYTEAEESKMLELQKKVEASHIKENAQESKAVLRSQ